jgi:hypothetical protein
MFMLLCFNVLTLVIKTSNLQMLYCNTFIIYNYNSKNLVDVIIYNMYYNLI